MKKSHLSLGKNKNIAVCIGIGLLVSLIISVGLTIGLTSLIQNGKLSENGATPVFIIRLIATLAGGLLGAGLFGKKFLPVIGAISAGYLIVLLAMGIILFDGSFHKLWMGALSVAVGAAIAILIKLKPQTTRKKALRYTR